ncbi:SEN1 N terminal-domain-containing protein [Xylariomycetidae sp. FL0641]|nr:SEN1 N terminal-domain-containing protein [Xylariomycetidae sp. FL0641]
MASGEAVNVLAEAFDQLQKIPPPCHLFCPKVSDEDDEVYEDPEAATQLSPSEKEQRIQEGAERVDIMYSCSMILGFDEGTGDSYREEFIERATAFLSSCPACVRNWHKGRNPFLKHLSAVYSDEVVAEIRGRLNKFDFERITRGLKAAEAFILSLDIPASQSVFIKSGKTELLIALYEAICCMPYLSLPDNRRQFNFVFEKIQERKILKLDEILPTMTYFLFDENQTRNRFAVHTLQRQPLITKDDFEWAVSENLAQAILKANDTNTDPKYLERFWQGFLLILDCLDDKLVMECVRGMNVQPTIYDLMVAQMARINSVSILKLLLQAFCGLIQKSPKAFWDAFGKFSPSAIMEQIIRSPAFRPLLQQSGQHDMTDDGPAATSWVKPFISSIPTHQKPDVCDNILHHLLDEIAEAEDMSSGGKAACYRGAMEALSSALSGFVAPTYKLHAGSSTISTNQLLNLGLKHKDLVCRLALLAGKDQQDVALSQAALSVIRLALALDSRITVEEFNAIQEDDKHVQREIKRNSPGLWEAFLEALQPGARAYELAKYMLGAFSPLICVEIFRPPKKMALSPVKREFNDAFQETTNIIGRMVDRLSDFESATLQQICSDSSMMLPIVATLVHGEDGINIAGVSLIKSITDEYGRQDALLKLLQGHFTTALTSYTVAVEQITDKRSLWSPQFRILRSSKDILTSLSDASSGILRSRTLTFPEQEALRKWWSSQWTFLDNAFNQTEAWTRMIEMETMKNFCREAMEHADALIAQDGVLAAALSPESSQSTLFGDDSIAAKSAMTEILEQPRMHCMGLCRMLRLKDGYLVSVIVSVLGRLLRRLKEYDMRLPPPPLKFIKDTSIPNAAQRYAINTNLTKAQRAELVRALGEEDTGDDVQILSVRPVEGPKKQTKLDAWSKSADGVPAAQPNEKPTPKASTDIRDVLKASSSEKARSTLDQMRARQLPPKSMPKTPAVSSIPSIREKRAKEAEEKRKRDAEAIAKARALRAPKSTVTGEGSGLQGLSGVHGKDHAPQKSEIMVNSSSEEEEDSDDDAEFLARTGTARKPQDTSKGISSMKKVPMGPVKKVKIQRSAKDMRARLIPPMDVLHQAILEWDIFHEGSDPPNGIQCTKVADNYTDPREYKETFLPLLINEAWRSFVTAKDENTSKPFGIKVVNRMNVDKFIEVSTAMPPAENKDRFLSEGDIVLLSLAANPLETRDELHCLARIWRTQFKGGTLEVQYRLSGRAGRIIAQLVPGAELYAIKITNMTTIEREYASLESLQYYDLAPEILEAKPSPMLNFSSEAVEQMMRNYQLNTGQAKAILNAKENDAFTLVQGPPGTGKTKTIVAMVGALLTGNLSTNGAVAIKRPGQTGSTTSKAPSKKLLVCAPSNAAVDELVLRLKDGVKSTNGSFHKVNVLRLGRTDAINAAVRDVTLDELVKKRVEGVANENKGPSSRELMHQEAGQIKKTLAELRPQLESARATGERQQINQLQRQFDELKRRQAQIGAKIDADKDSGNTTQRENEIRRRQIQQEILDSAQVLCATLSGSGHEMFRHLAVEFETVIIDEAAQCVELSALIPLKYGCSKCVLVGDPKQLPPTVLSQSAARYGYDQSLFVRMQHNHPNDVHLLDTQYRMHPEISSFPSQEFYERRLVDGDDMRRLRYQPWHQSALLGPYRFFDVKGSQQQGRRGQSLVNLEELRVAMQLYERFKTDYPESDAKGKIGIITPYKAQLFELRDRFARQYGNGIQEIIEFNTTDAFQGRECEIIIFSCVRASSTGGIGFMQDIRRMNVGLTRAKSSLWILGDSRALVQGPFWKKLIEDAQARDRYTAGNVLAMLKSPGARMPPPNFSGPAPPSAPTSIPSRNLSPPPGRDDDLDVIMQDASQMPRPVPNKRKTPQLPKTYDIIERSGSNYPPNANLPQFSGINERGEAVSRPATANSNRPVIHISGQSGQKRHRGDSDDEKPTKKPATGTTPIRPPPSGPRAAPRPRDPSAEDVLGIPPPRQSSSANQRGPGPMQPPRDPSNPSLPQRPPRPPPGPALRRKAPADPFIRRKPKGPR